MKKDSILYGLIGAGIGALAMLLIMSSVVNSNNTDVMRMVGMRGIIMQGKMQNSDAINAHFIEQMIPHHEDAITMATLAKEKAQREDVKMLAQNIITSQSKEIDQMKQWYRDWYGKDVPAGSETMQGHGMTPLRQGFAGQVNKMHMGMMGDQSDINRLENASDFDTVFVEEMIPHHQMAVMMAGMLKSSTTRPEMKKLADDIISSQSKEIDQMRQWLKEWDNEQ